MKLDLKEFLPKLALANKVVNPKPSMPIMGCFLLHAKDGVLHVNTSDKESTISVSIKPLEFSEMEICVNASDFFSALSNIGSGEVEIVLNPDKKLIRCSYSNGYFQLPYDDDKTASSVLEIQHDDYFVDKDINDSIILSEAIEKASIAAAEDTLKPVLCGVYFDFKQDGMVAVACDQNKMSKFKTDIKFESDTPGFILPNRGADILKSLLKETDSVNIKVGDKSAMFTGEEFIFTTRLTEGMYPKYDMLIPSDNTQQVIINKSAALSAIKRVSFMESNEGGMIVLNFDANSLIIEAEDIAFKKKAKEKLSVNYTGEPMRIGIKSSNIVALLQAMDSEEVVVSFKSPKAAVVVEPKADLKQLITLVMPMITNAAAAAANGQ
jgi:DNA polymerase-3 subunit beta